MLPKNSDTNMIAFGVLLLAVSSLADPLFRPRLDGRIVGGHDVNIEQYPHQLSLQRSGYHICGASILSSNWVLTAAHCVSGASASSMSVRSGSSIRGQGGQVSQVKRIIVHERYGNLDNDIALLEVDSIKLSDKAKPIKLATAEPQAGTKVEVSGWGALSSGGSSPSQLQAVTVDIVDRKVCNQEYGGSITGNMICAASAGKDSCQGDSGGPLINGNGEQIGIVSFGRGCAEPGYAGVYSNVASLRKWIRDNCGI